MRTRLIACVVAVASLTSFAAVAEPYVDYTPQKGLWHVVTIKVDPSHLDDYVTALKKNWVPGEEVAKKHGLIDSYQVMAKMNPEGPTGNVLLIEHLPNTAVLDADRERDQAVQREVYAAVSKADEQKAVEGFDKYRTFLSDEYWNELTFTK